MEFNFMEKLMNKNNNYNVDAIEKAIELLGGAEKLARKLEVSYTTVFKWRKGQSVPSLLKCIDIEIVTENQVKREEILPNFPWEKLEKKDKNND
jgi:DNA-binding transcriptional regulator YdaS (Cro superfamily)